MEYKITVAGPERSLPLCPVSDSLYNGGIATPLKRTGSQ